MSCSHGWNVVGTLVDCVGDAVGTGVSSAFTGIMESVVSWLTNMMLEAISTVLTTLSSFWVNIKTPTGAISQDPSSVVGFMWSTLGWYNAAILVFAVLVGAGRIVIMRKAQPAVELLRGLALFAMVNAAGIPLVLALIAASDAFSDWIITTATGSDFATGLSTMLNFGVGGSAIVLVLLVLLGLLAILGSILQIVLMVMRSAMLVLLVTVLPLSASALNTETGRQWFRKVVAWLAAFLLYKPVASIIYATAFRLLASGDTDGVLSVIMGITLMALAILALPALMRFLVPAVASTAGGGGAGAVIGGAIATGAAVYGGGMLLRQGGGAATGAGASGGAGPSGAGGTAGGSDPSGGGGPAGGAGPPGAGGSAGAAGSSAPPGPAAGHGSTAAGSGAAGAGAAAAGPAVAAVGAAGQAASAPSRSVQSQSGEGGASS